MIYPWQGQLFGHVMHQRDCLPSAWLLQGPAGIGKRDFAWHLAQALLCEGGVGDAAPCGQCAPCHWFKAGHHPDFRSLGLEEEAPSETSEEAQPPRKPSGQITVDAVRALEPFLQAGTHRQGLRVVVIEPAEALNLHAANALLKTLEEPPAGTLFLLVTPVHARLPATLRSRCRKLPFPIPPREKARSWLSAQGVEDPDLLLALAGGAPLFALRLANQEGSARLQWLKQLADPAISLPQLSESTAKWPVSEWLGWLQRWVHDLLSQKLVHQACFHVDLASLSARQAERADLAVLLVWERQIRAARRLENHPLNPRLLAESLLLPALSMR